MEMGEMMEANRGFLYHDIRITAHAPAVAIASSPRPRILEIAREPGNDSERGRPHNVLADTLIR